jgi:hypothetical protein
LWEASQPPADTSRIPLPAANFLKNRRAGAQKSSKPLFYNKGLCFGSGDFEQGNFDTVLTAESALAAEWQGNFDTSHFRR